jgi:orotate phosphoribosyltransferase
MQHLLTELRDVIARQSIRRGKFVLASGGTSDYYCDTKATTLSPEGAKLTGEVLFELLKDQGVEAVGGLAMGAAFIATAVALVSAEHGHPIYGFTVRESQKGHGLEKTIEESFHPDGRALLCPGRRVALVDDVVTRGGSVLKAFDAVQALGCEIVTVIALVDRNAGGAEKLRERGLPYVFLFRTDSEGNLLLNDFEGTRLRPGVSEAGSPPRKPPKARRSV